MCEKTWEMEASRLTDAFEDASRDVLEAMEHVPPVSINADILLFSMGNVRKTMHVLACLLGSAPAHADAQAVYVATGDVLDACGTLRYLVLNRYSDNVRNVLVPALEQLGDIVLEMQETAYDSLARR